MGQDFPTSPNQYAYCLFETAQAGSANMVEAKHVMGPLDLDALQAAIEAVVRRHEALRTAVRRSDTGRRSRGWERLYLFYSQVVEDAADVELHAIDSLEELATSAPFSLDKPPLFRVGIHQLGPERNLLALTTNHVVSDTWSLNVLWRDLATFYDVAIGRGMPPPPVTKRFGVHVEADLERRRAGAWEPHVQFWHRHLSGVTPRRFPSLDGPPPPNGSRAAITYRLDQVEAAALESVIDQTKASSFAVVLGLYAVALHRLFGWDDIIIASPYANRHDRSTWDTVGLFANLVLWRFVVRDQQTIDVVRQARTVVAQTFKRGWVTLDAVTRAMPPDERRALNERPQIAIRQQPQTGGRMFSGTVEASLDEIRPDLRLGFANPDLRTDLLLDISPAGGEVVLRVRYLPATVSHDSAAALLAEMLALLKHAD